MSNIEAGTSIERQAVTHHHTLTDTVGRGMSLTESIRVALDGLIANKMRSFLTMLGIIIGVSAVIIMVSLGQGVAKATQEQIAKLGTNVLTVISTGRSRGPVNTGLGSQQNFRLEHTEMIQRGSPSVAAISPEFRGNAQVQYKNQNTRTNIMGVTPEYFGIRNLPIAKGRTFTSEEVARRAKVAVIGDTVRDTLFGRVDAVGKYIRVNGQNFLVVGVVEPRGAAGWRSPDDQVTVPVTTAMFRIFGVDYLTSFSVQAKSSADLIKAQEEVTAVLNRVLKTPPGMESEIRVFNQADLIESAAAQTGFLTMLLAGIALVSLIVGGIGIMNIMLVSVTERTREIGIRKAIGAKRKDILYQFMIESTTLSIVGGLIGVTLGILVSLWMALPAQSGGLGFPTHITMPPILISFGFAALVGIFFGIYPAMKASKLNPIDALRYE